MVGGPKNLAARRSEGTKLFGPLSTHFCQSANEKSAIRTLSLVEFVEICALFGGSNGPKSMAGGPPQDLRTGLSLTIIRLFESNNDVLKFESRLKEFLMDCRSQSLPIMTRGLPISPYWTTTDDRLVEAPITKVVYDQQSDHQHIMVLDTTDFGKLLVLDDQANLGESDSLYTTTLMGGGTEDFKDKQVS